MSKTSPSVLEQARLDVVDKSRSNIFNWRGQFTPQFVEYLLDTFVCENDVTFDPFCGSGTVLLESARRNISSVGYEINPAAYAMAKFVTLSTLPLHKRRQMCESLVSYIQRLTGTYHDLPLFEIDGSYRDRYKNLLDFARDLLSLIENKKEMLLALNSLFNVEKTGNGNLIKAVRRSFENIKGHLLNLPLTSARLRADLCDARLSHKKLCESVDVIITSPPYINVFNYHQNYRVILEILGFDILKVAQSEIGSNRKNRGNRFRTVVQYALEMEQALDSFAYSLKRDGFLILIVGRESRVRGMPFSNSKILENIACSMNCYAAEMVHERVFTNRFGKTIKEDILVFRKIDKTPTTGNGRQVAYEQLEMAHSLASGDVYNDITEAISQVDEIQASPLFSLKGVI